MIDPKFQLHRIVCKDEQRANITAPYLDVEAKRLVATNGHALVAVAVEIQDGDVSGHRDPVTLRPIGSRGTFPRWREIVPNHAVHPVASVAVDPVLLGNVAKAIGCRTVILEFRRDDPEAPILVQPVVGRGMDVIAVQMPVRR